MYIKTFVIGIITISIMGIIASIFESLSGFVFGGGYLISILGLIVSINHYKKIAQLNKKLDVILTIPVVLVLFNTLFFKYQRTEIFTHLRVATGITLFWYFVTRIIVLIVGLFKKKDK